MTFTLTDFLRESLRIEGIHREPTQAECDTTIGFLALPALSVAALEILVSVYEPGARLRDRAGMDVRVGDHFPPPGGPKIMYYLEALLRAIDQYTPYEAHVRYETLHPFTDGNGRSGRAIWLWQMKEAPLGFLHSHYYQSLQAARCSGNAGGIGK